MVLKKAQPLLLAITTEHKYPSDCLHLHLLPKLPRGTSTCPELRECLSAPHGELCEPQETLNHSSPAHWEGSEWEGIMKYWEPEAWI